MNQKTAVLIGVLFLIAACTPSSFDRDYTFLEGFEAFMKIDQEFNTSFHVEMLNTTMAPQTVIPQMKEEIKKLKAKIDATTKRNANQNDSAALSLFADIRLLMLDSQLSYQKALEIGPIGRVTDPQGFSCAEMKYILLTSAYLNQSYWSGLQAQSKLDDLIYIYREIPMLRTLIGIDENKTAWFYSPLFYPKNEVDANIKALQKRCNIDTVFAPQ